jgi:hypothetical protein
MLSDSDDGNINYNLVIIYSWQMGMIDILLFYQHFQFICLAVKEKTVILLTFTLAVNYTYHKDYQTLPVAFVILHI